MSSDDDRVADAIRDLSSRVPQYAKLSASLARDGAMRAHSQSPLTKVLGNGGFVQLARWVPQLRQLDHTLMSIGAIRYALDEMQSERAEEHMQAAGLTRAQIERDYLTMSTLGRRLSADAARNARRLLHGGAHHAGRLTGKGLRAFRRWKKQWDKE